MAQKQTFEAWITKYALTKGIFKVQAELSNTSSTTMIIVRDEENNYMHFYHHEGKDWHRSRQAAEEKANKMRLEKIQSLKQQIEKLETMTFAENGSE